MHQCNLFVGERQNFLPIDAEHADKLVFPEQRHDEERACAGTFDQVHIRGKAVLIRRVFRQIFDLKEPLGRDDASKPRQWVRAYEGFALPLLGEGFRRVVDRSDAE